VVLNSNNYTLVRQGHYDFGYTFNEPGIYSIAVDIKDIFYIIGIAKFAFDIVVDDSVIDSVDELIGNYYYVFNTKIIMPVISVLVNLRTKKVKD
jgi:hypothetical protein